MKSIELDNNYIVQIVEKGDLIPDVNDIQLISWKHIKEKNVLVAKVDFSLYNACDYKRILKNFLHLKEKSFRHHVNIGFESNKKHVVAFLCNFNQCNQHHIDFINCLNATLYNNKVDMYNYIYDEVCEFLDRQFSEKNLCDFKDDRCAYKRGTSCTVGCCRHFKIKLLPLTKLVTCEYLKNKSCTAKCISCKLFTCDYLQKNGVKFKIKDIPLLDTFFSPIQKYFIKYKVFTPKEKIIKLICFF